MLIKLDIAWKYHPDYRLGQLISNLMGPGPHDVFFLEDDEWEKLIDSQITDKDREEVNAMCNVFEGGKNEKSKKA